MKSILHIFLLTCLIRCGTSVNEKKQETKIQQQPETKNISTTVKDTANLKTLPVQVKKESPPKISHPETIGLWLVKPNSFSNPHGVVLLSSTYVFNYDGIYITIPVLMVNGGTSSVPCKWISKDGYYKLKTEWHGDSLFYHSLFKRTEFMARFIDSLFLRTDSIQGTNCISEYKRITKKELPDYLRPILKKRNVFNYNLIKHIY